MASTDNKYITQKYDSKQELNKQQRRTRYDQINRNNHCGCGKSYLSYPALYTHIKQKHGNLPPKGTCMPVKQSQKDEQQQKYELIADEKQKNNEYDIPIKQMVINSLPREIFINEQQYWSFLKVFEDVQPNSNEQRMKKNLNSIFALFLIEFFPLVKKEIFIEIAIFIMFCRNSLNLYGQSKLVEPNNEYCNQEDDAEVLLQMANDLIIDYLPLHYSEISFNYDIFDIVGPNEYKMKNQVYLLTYLSEWLFLNNYSKFILELNMEQQEPALEILIDEFESEKNQITNCI